MRVQRAAGVERRRVGWGVETRGSAERRVSGVCGPRATGHGPRIACTVHRTPCTPSSTKEEENTSEMKIQTRLKRRRG